MHSGIQVWAAHGNSAKFSMLPLLASSSCPAAPVFGSDQQMAEPWKSVGANAVDNWAQTVKTTTQALDEHAGTPTAFGYPSAFDKNPAPDLLNLHPEGGYPSGNGIPLIYLSNMLAQRNRDKVRRSRRRPDRDEAPVEGGDELDTQLAVGNDWYSQMSVPGLRGESLKRFAKQMQGGARRDDAPYLQAGQGWAPGDYELSGIYEDQQAAAAGQKNWRSLERDAHTAEAMAAGMTAQAASLERSARPQTPPAQPLPPSAQKEAEAEALQRVLTWRQRMQDPRHMAWIREHAADHPLDLSQQRAMAQSKAAKVSRREPVVHADGSPPDPWEAALPVPVDLVAGEPRLVRMQREGFQLPSAKGEKVDTWWDHQQL